MGSKDTPLNEVIKSLSSFITLVLPFLSFAFQWLPETLKAIFLERELFFFTSLITALLSLFIILSHKANPYYRRVLSRKEEQEYSQYLKDTDPQIPLDQRKKNLKVVLPPREINQKTLAQISGILVFFTGVLFLALGVNFKGVSDPLVNLLQAILYILFFVLSVYVLAVYTFEDYLFKKDDFIKKERIRRAINLAVENNAFNEFPKVNFVYSNEYFGVPSILRTGVRINGQLYEIVTDRIAENLIVVAKINETSDG